MEINILNFVQAYRNSFLDAFMALYTSLNNHGELWLIVLALFAIKKETRMIALFGFVALVTEFILVEGVVKHLVQRPRPFIENPAIQLLIKSPSGYSFPSGHAASSFAVTTFLGLCKVRYKKTLLSMAFLMALSRVYLYVHYPTDILAGALLGICIGHCVYRFSKYKGYIPIIANAE